MFDMRKRLAVTVACAVSAAAQQGWYPHEGGPLKYRVNIRFGEEPDTMPAGWKLGRVSSVAVDAEGQVYVFQRGAKADPLIVFDAKGRYLRSFGKGVFANPHAVRIGPDGHLWLTDTGLHQVLKFTRDGRPLLALGTKGVAGADAGAFNRPTDVAFSPSGDYFYVSDGYGNSRVVKFTREGKYVSEWGRKGAAPGEFNLPHAIQCDARGRLYVSDRENNRIQIFNGDGELLRVWTHLGATQGMHITPDGQLWILTHRDNIENAAYDTLAGRIMRVDLESGRILGSMECPGHWLALSPAGEIFVASLTGNVFRWYPGWIGGK